MLINLVKHTLERNANQDKNKNVTVHNAPFQPCLRKP